MVSRNCKDRRVRAHELYTWNVRRGYVCMMCAHWNKEGARKTGERRKYAQPKNMSKLPVEREAKRFHPGMLQGSCVLLVLGDIGARRMSEYGAL